MRFAKYGVGGMFFLLPLFFLLPPLANSFEAQIQGAKLMLVFGLGNLFFAVYLGKKIHPSFFLIHAAFTVGALFTGFGAMQLYPFVYWSAAAGLTLLFLTLEEETQVLLLRCVVWGGVASSMLAFLQVLDLDPILTYAPGISDADRVLPVGLMGQTTKFGALLAILIGVAFGLKDYSAALLMTVAAVATNSSFTYLAVFGALIVNARYLLGRFVTVAICISFFFTAAILWAFSPGSALLLDNGRYLVWWTTLEAWWNGPKLLGFGPGSFAYLYAENFQPKSLVYGSFLQAHNDYIQALFEFGLMGAAVMAALLFFIGRHFCLYWWGSRYQEKAPLVIAAEGGLIAIVLNGMGNFPFQLAPHFLLATICFAIIVTYQPRKDW